MQKQYMPFVIDDGGRSAAGYKGTARDCVVRAIAIATGKPYEQIYEDLFAAMKYYAETNTTNVANRIRHIKRSSGAHPSPRNGVWDVVWEPYLKALGWRWIPTMGIGTGCKIHLRPGELPNGRLIVKVSRHLVAVIDGVMHDMNCPDRGGRRCVYGYFIKPAPAADRRME